MKECEINDRVYKEITMDECVNRRKNASTVGSDRVKSRIKHVYVLCEDLRNSFRNIKVECGMKGSVNKCIDGMDVSEIPSKEMDEAHSVGSCLQKFACNESRKVTKFVASQMMNE